jgi:dsDNA-binding SOS-regulon protein
VGKAGAVEVILAYTHNLRLCLQAAKSGGVQNSGPVPLPWCTVIVWSLTMFGKTAFGPQMLHTKSFWLLTLCYGKSRKEAMRIFYKNNWTNKQWVLYKCSVSKAGGFMAVIIKYIVERAGVEKMTFSSKPEADAYDRMLDIADELFLMLGQSELIPDEQQREDLALYLAQQKELVIQTLNQKTKSNKAPVADKEQAKDKRADTTKAAVVLTEVTEASDDLAA